MPRPRRPFSGVENIELHSEKWMQDELQPPLGVRQRQRWLQSENLTYPHPNSQFDPLTFLRVLDAVANINPDVELRSNKLAEWLNFYVKTLLFDAITVGKVLSDLCDGFEDVLGRKTGLLERGRDWRGNFYRIHRNPETASLYRRLREDLMRLATFEATSRSLGRKTDRIASPLLECPSLRGEWVDVEDA